MLAKLYIILNKKNTLTSGLYKYIDFKRYIHSNMPQWSDLNKLLGDCCAAEIIFYIVFTYIKFTEVMLSNKKVFHRRTCCCCCSDKEEYDFDRSVCTTATYLYHMLLWTDLNNLYGMQMLHFTKSLCTKFV